ncbi:MAG: acyl-CoA dehydratase activase, partial [Syntrophomonadaceae bacterium]|nr:acyl-CoA dehydratase activase [Syntrophomonadaceae bacterium]
VATGYGKITVRVAGAVHIPEIQAHVLGACASTGLQSFTLLDIGGQDTKVVQVRRGQVKDFLTNDRCAASSGRYLEHMAEILGISVEELGRYDERPVELNATCAIFGETEIIGKIIAGASTEELAAGVNYAVFRRCAPMLRRLPSEVVVMAGGGALNPALARIVSRELGVETVALADPQFNGARGCCAYGRDMGWS